MAESVESVERLQYAANLFPRNSSGSKNITDFLSNYKNVETERRGADKKMAHLTTDHPVFKRLFEQTINAVDAKFMDLISITHKDNVNVHRFNEFIETWGRQKKMYTEADNTKNNEYNTAEVLLPILLLNIFPQASVKHAATNGDCSIHASFSCIFPAFSHLTSKGMVEFVEISKTNILPYLLFRSRGLFQAATDTYKKVHPVTKAKTCNVSGSTEPLYPIEYCEEKVRDIHLIIKDIRTPKKFLSDDEIRSIFKLFGINGTFFAPSFINEEGNTGPMSLSNFGPASDSTKVIFSLAPYHFMPIKNGATWDFNYNRISSITDLITPNESQSGCIFPLSTKGSSVVYNGEEYYIVDRSTGSGIKIGEITVTNAVNSNTSDVDILLKNLTAGLKHFSKTIEIDGEYEQKQKDEYKDLLIRKILDKLKPPCNGYILLKKDREFTIQQIDTVKNAVNFKEALPQEIDKVGAVTLVKVENESLITGAGQVDPSVQFPEMEVLDAELNRLFRIFTTGTQKERQAEKEKSLVVKKKKTSSEVKRLMKTLKIKEKKANELVQNFMEVVQLSEKNIVDKLIEADGNLEIAVESSMSGGGIKRTHRLKKRRNNRTRR
jgi:hypothetical protein